ncbi:beta-lactamase family protein [Saccharothrix sp. NEAU-S10]|nr:beta-lactamase family protein [Saccharothrix luteola]
MLAACLTAALDEDWEQYTARRLFAPLGITRWRWPRDPEGLPYEFGHLELSASDPVRFGWYQTRDRSAYGRDAVTAHTPGGPPEGVGYGYLWRVTEMAGHPAFFAGGYAGQHLVVVPSLELVAVTTGKEAALRDGWRPGLDAVRGIVAAVATR